MEFEKDLPMQRIHEVLADGRWDDRQSVLTAAANAVPPGPAYRAALQARKEYSPEGEEARAIREKSILIMLGQQRLALQALNGDARIKARVRGDAHEVRLWPVNPMVLVRRPVWTWTS